METTIDNAEQWREASSGLYSLIWQSVQEAGAEIITYATDEHGTIDRDKAEDSVHDWADGLLPVYYGEQVREWYALGLPDLDDTGLSNGDVFSTIVGALYEWYSVELSRVVSALLEEAGY
jgi:hypothetical protein